MGDGGDGGRGGGGAPASARGGRGGGGGGGGEKKKNPLFGAPAARWGGVEGEVRAEDFLEGGFFGGEDRINVSLTNPPIRAHLRSAKLPTETGSYTLLLQHRSGQLFYPCSLPQSHHFPVLQNCEPHDLPSLCCPTLCRGDMQH